jgi:hypothetical protein
LLTRQSIMLATVDLFAPLHGCIATNSSGAAALASVAELMKYPLGHYMSLVAVRASETAGVGLYAKRLVPPGTLFALSGGDQLTMAQAKKIAADMATHIRQVSAHEARDGLPWARRLAPLMTGKLREEQLRLPVHLRIELVMGTLLHPSAAAESLGRPASACSPLPAFFLLLRIL